MSNRCASVHRRVKAAAGAETPSLTSSHEIELVERHHQEAFAAERVVPGVEVHEDRDITWVVHAGNAWRNAGIMVRLSAANARRRLDTIVARYKKHGRGMAMWVSPLATPVDFPKLLAARQLRCRKHFPAMLRMLDRRVSPLSRVAGLEIRSVMDINEFVETPYPAIGPLTTTLRRQAFARLHALLSEPSQRTRLAVAWLDGSPVGAIELFNGSQAAVVYGLSVLDEHQGRGIGSALLEHACADARQHEVKAIVLLATTEGQRLYLRRGFREVARFGYWYRSFQRNLHER
jgi:ribosomal protein S18 acetylase RimI-like enzyme